MGWSDDMYEAGLTKEHGGLMEEERTSLPRSSRNFASRGKSKSGRGSRWTANDRKEMIGLYENDVSIRTISKILNRTPYGIAYQLFNMNKITENVKHNFKANSAFDTSYGVLSSTESEKLDIHRLFNKNISIVTIAEHKTRSSHSVAIELYNNKQISKKECDKFAKNLSHDISRMDFEKSEELRLAKQRESNKNRERIRKAENKKQNTEQLLQIIVVTSIIIGGFIIAHT
jgi:IS30 family transposase